MDSEKLKGQRDCDEIKKVNDLRLFLYQLRGLIHHPDAGEVLYNDIIELIEFVEEHVEPLLECFTSNYLENAKRWFYMMLKYAGMDFIKMVDARRQNIPLTICKTNLLESLHLVHEEYFNIIFDPSFKEWLNKAKIVSILKKYLEIMSYVFYDFEKDIKPLTSKQIKEMSCYFCQINSSFLGVGRFATSFTFFLKYFNLCKLTTKPAIFLSL